MRKIGALEAGGTKMVLAVYLENGQKIKEITLPTQEPAQTMPPMICFFEENQIDALGVGIFGPLDLNPQSPNYGSITSTPKLAWRGYPLLKSLLNRRSIPDAIDTDVNAAILAEKELGAAQGCQNAVYVTVGTGIGGGVLVNGQPVHGMLHPEVGHMLLRPHPQDPNPRGVCPYHDGCLEGLAAGPAIGARVHGDARELPDDDPTFAIEAFYLAQMCVNLIMTLSPERIILGGGVMQQMHLFPHIREKTLALLGGYVDSDRLTPEGIDGYIVPPALGINSGVAGALLLGARALEARD